MYRTDKQFMKNPATASSRIYVGSLQKTVVADDLEAKFKVHGNILGLVLQTGFAFIQYEHDHEAQRAIEREHNSMLHGRKLNVRQALDKGQKPGGNNQNFKPSPHKFQGNQNPPQNFPPKPNTNIPHPPSLMQQQIDISQLNQPENENIPVGTEDDDNEPPHIQPPVQADRDNKDNWERDNFDKGNRGRKSVHRGGQHHGGGRDKGKFRDEPFFPKGQMMPPASYPPVIDHPPPTTTDRNDCEIIVVAKALTEYAEFIEQRLKQLGLIVDLLFPNEDVPIGRVLANISSRGCLYAILVMPQNEEHRSLTLNILHGLPQEHRNMPIEDALLLISRNFETYMRGDPVPVEKTGEMTLSDKHPVPMQMLFNLLAENRQLTTAQYDKLLKYLEERRELQHQHEVAEGVEQDSQESTGKQAELQSRIMNILNKSAPETAVPLSITSTEPPAASTPTPLLKDPSVQKALDSLFLGDMLKNMNA